jgi:hypothetical protein
MSTAQDLRTEGKMTYLTGDGCVTGSCDGVLASGKMIAGSHNAMLSGRDAFSATETLG